MVNADFIFNFKNEKHASDKNKTIGKKDSSGLVNYVTGFQQGVQKGYKFRMVTHVQLLRPFGGGEIIFNNRTVYAIFPKESVENLALSLF